MKTRLNLIILIITVILIGSCNPLIIEEPNLSYVSIDTGITLGFAGSRASVSDVASFRLKVEASDMEEIEQTYTESIINIKVEAGSGRTFTLTAFDAIGNNLFSGSSKVDLVAGQSAEIVITMDYSGFYVIFNTNGGGTISTKYVESGGILTTPTVPVKTGYAFGGWYSDADFIALWNFSTDTVNSDVTLYAKWTANTYSLTFDGNGSSGGAMTNLSVDYDGTVSLTSNGYTLTGYTFIGWNTASNGSGIYYADTASYTHTTAGNITLYAQWQVLPSLNFIQTDVLGSTSPYTGWNWTRYNDTVNSNSFLITPSSSANYYTIEVSDGTETVFTSIQLYDTGNWSTATINFYAYSNGVQTGSETYTGDVPYATGGYKHTFSDTAFSNADMIVIQPLQSDGTSPTPICLDDIITDLFGTIDFETTTGLSGTSTPTVTYTP